MIPYAAMPNIGTVPIFVDSKITLPDINPGKPGWTVIHAIEDEYTNELLVNYPSKKPLFEALTAICVVPGNKLPYKDADGRLIIYRDADAQHALGWFIDNGIFSASNTKVKNVIMLAKKVDDKKFIVNQSKINRIKELNTKTI